MSKLLPGDEARAAIDQAAALLSDNFPPMWRRLYEALLDQGFTEVESMKLLQTYILSNSPNGVRGTD